MATALSYKMLNGSEGAIVLLKHHFCFRQDDPADLLSKYLGSRSTLLCRLSVIDHAFRRGRSSRDLSCSGYCLGASRLNLDRIARPRFRQFEERGSMGKAATQLKARPGCR